MITLKINPFPSSLLDRIHMRELVGFYRGTANFSGSDLMVIEPKEDFNLNGLLLTLRTSEITVEEI